VIEIPFVPTISSVLLILYGHDPHPGVKLYQLDAIRSVNPYLCPNLGVCVHCGEVRLGGCMIILSPEFNGRGAAFSILEFICL
jgi:hypothetical protein